MAEACIWPGVRRGETPIDRDHSCGKETTKVYKWPRVRQGGPLEVPPPTN